MPHTLAIFCSDIHLSHKAPVARSAEPDWYAAMARVLEEIRSVQEQHGARIYCAGDIFDKWNSPPQLVNWASSHLPTMFSVAGQHDLAHHNLQDIKNTSYHSLCLMGAITHLSQPTKTSKMVIHPFSWNEKMQSADDALSKKKINVSLNHRYCWNGHHKHPMAQKSDSVKSMRSALGKYDVNVFGDNHKGFICQSKTKGQITKVINCGTLFRRKIDEIDYIPAIYFLKSDLSITSYLIDTTEDQFIDITSKEGRDLKEYENLILELQEVGGEFLDFLDTAKQYIRKANVSSTVRKLILEAIQEGTEK